MEPSVQMTPDAATARRRVLSLMHRHWKWLLFEGILLVILGMLAVAVPNFSTLEIELLVGWLFLIGGLVRVINLLRRRHTPGFWWSLVSGIIAMALGALLLGRPLQGVVTLTLVMTLCFVVEGAAAVFVALAHHRFLRHWGLILMSGLINLLLAYLIWSGWPSTASWVIGLYVGIYMIFVGVPLIMTAIVARRAAGDSA